MKTQALKAGGAKAENCVLRFRHFRHPWRSTLLTPVPARETTSKLVLDELISKFLKEATLGSPFLCLSYSDIQQSSLCGRDHKAIKSHGLLVADLFL